MVRKRITLVKDFDEILKRGDLEECKSVFDKCDINAKTGLYKTNAFGCKPLTREFAFWLKDNGCDIEFKDTYDQTPIFYHVTAFNDEFDLMIELGANIFVKDTRGLSLLHKTASFCNIKATKILLDHGFDINTKLNKTFYRTSEYTPLEYMFIYSGQAAPTLLSYTEFMIENGATVTDEVKKLVLRKGEEFEFYRDGYVDKAISEEYSNAFEKLYKIVGVEPPKKIIKHDGISDIIIEESNFGKAYTKLWDYLVPGSGRAKSAQGECIRLAGKLSYEILDNGGVNWCNDFKLMAKTLGKYFKIGNALDSDKIKIADEIIKCINPDDSEENLTTLSKFAVEWIRKNPKVLPLIDDKYKR